MGTVQLEPGVILEYSDEWSFKILPNRPSDIPDGTVIYASDFSHEIPDSTPFREDMVGVEFHYCNLSNVIIPNQEGA